MPPTPEPELSTLANGLRVVTLPLAWRPTVSLSVFIRTGSLHETPRTSGISHVVEHMAFKGTATRDCQRINLDAERLGAEVNAHTDKDHTAFHIDGLARDAGAFVTMLADIVQHSTFPADELERERQVILQELTEVEEDPEWMAFNQFDKACYGQHAAARPVIGQRANIERLQRDDLLAYVAAQYTASNVVVAIAGAVDPAQAVRDVEAAFGAMPRGRPNPAEPAAWQGGLKLRRMGGSAQTHWVLGFEAPTLADEGHEAWTLAAAVFGEGMSSPLLDEIRERRGLAYHAACAADVLPLTGQFVVDAVTDPRHAADCLTEVARLLQEHAQGIAPVAFERARNQLTVRVLRGLEQPARRLEAAAQDIYTRGRPRRIDENLERLQSVSAESVRGCFERMLASPAALALAGQVPAKVRDQAERLFSL